MTTTVVPRIVKTVEDARLVDNKGPRSQFFQAIPMGVPEVYDPFLYMSDRHFSLPEGGFPSHPHRGFETVTMIYSGQQEHKDSTGASGIIKAGDVQWMSAGKGVIHSEMPITQEVCHGYQLWVNMPAKNKMDKAHYQELSKEKIPVKRVKVDGASEDVVIRVISGSSGDVVAQTKNYTPVLLLDVTIPPQATYTIDDIPSTFNGFAYVIDGHGKLGGRAIKDHQRALLPPLKDHRHPDSDVPDVSSLVAENPSKGQPFQFLLIVGQPLYEPVVQQGPFVMSTQKDLEQAFRDYQSGRLI